MKRRHAHTHGHTQTQANHMNHIHELTDGHSHTNTHALERKNIIRKERVIERIRE